MGQNVKNIGWNIIAKSRNHSNTLREKTKVFWEYRKRTPSSQQILYMKKKKKKISEEQE